MCKANFIFREGGGVREKSAEGAPGYPPAKLGTDYNRKQPITTDSGTDYNRFPFLPFSPEDACTGVQA
eukprot:632951-Amphidinium_carterae.1